MRSVLSFQATPGSSLTLLGAQFILLLLLLCKERGSIKAGESTMQQVAACAGAAAAAQGAPPVSHGVQTPELSVSVANIVYMPSSIGCRL